MAADDFVRLRIHQMIDLYTRRRCWPRPHFPIRLFREFLGRADFCHRNPCPSQVLKPLFSPRFDGIGTRVSQGSP